MIRVFDVAIVGATGAIGEIILATLEEQGFPVGFIYLLASERTAGSEVKFKKKAVMVELLSDFDFAKTQIVFFAANSTVSQEYVPKAVAAGAIVIDNTTQFSDFDDIPMVVPEVNPDAVGEYKNRGIIVSPSSVTIQMAVVLKPIFDAVGIERVNVATYQAVSGAGKQATEELAMQTASMLNGNPIESKIFSKQIAFNAVPQVDAFTENGYTKEEMRMVTQTKKIMGDDHIAINPTAVYIPVFYGCSQALHIETRKKITVKTATTLLQNAPGITVLDERKTGGFPTAVTESSGDDAVFVGRLREDISHQQGLNMWVVTDNIRKGAALNSVQIAQILVNDYL